MNGWPEILYFETDFANVLLPRHSLAPEDDLRDSLPAELVVLVNDLLQSRVSWGVLLGPDKRLGSSGGAGASGRVDGGVGIGDMTKSVVGSTGPMRELRLEHFHDEMGERHPSVLLRPAPSEEAARIQFSRRYRYFAEKRASLRLRHRGERGAGLRRHPERLSQRGTTREKQRRF